MQTPSSKHRGEVSCRSAHRGILYLHAHRTLWNASCEAESEYTGGTYYESTTLQFTTTDEIRQMQQLAFVVTDVNNHTYVIGCKEAPYPVVDITTNLDNETNISEVKVTFQRQKSLIPCVV